MFTFKTMGSGGSRGSSIQGILQRFGIGGVGQQGGALLMEQPWQVWFSNMGQQLFDLFTALDAIGGIGAIMDLPFDGVLGSGRDGALSISADTVATEPIPIYQLESLNIAAGKTWTMYNSQPGGLICSIKGLCTIAGIIDADGKGAKGGAGKTGVSPGTIGEAGFALAGGGGGGGASSTSVAGSEGGGHGGPTKANSILAGFNVGGFTRTAASTQFFDLQTAPSSDDLRAAIWGSSSLYLTPSGNGGTAAGAAGTAGTAMSVNLHNDPFGLVWALQRASLFGWGGGGGGGGAGFGGAGTSGVGGNGGGLILILCDQLDFSGTINARGAAGTVGNNAGGAGGGGGGGCVLIGYRELIANTGTINVGGGTGATGAGGGGNGGNGGTGYSRIFGMRI